MQLTRGILLRIHREEVVAIWHFVVRLRDDVVAPVDQNLLLDGVVVVDLILIKR
jgi:hypothetical protein